MFIVFLGLVFVSFVAGDTMEDIMKIGTKWSEILNSVKIDPKGTIIESYIEIAYRKKKESGRKKSIVEYVMKIGTKLSEILNSVKIDSKKSIIKSFTAYPTKKDSVFKKSIVEYVNDEDMIPWDEVYRSLKLPRLQLHEYYPRELFVDWELFVDYLRVVANVSEEMLIDRCDDVIFYSSGCYLLQIKNTQNSVDVVAFIEINDYRTFLRKYLRESYELSSKSVLGSLWVLVTKNRDHLIIWFLLASMGPVITLWRYCYDPSF
jgi:hypothetical protein